MKCIKFVLETCEGIQNFSPDNKDTICVSQVKRWLKLTSNCGCLNLFSIARWSCCSLETPWCPLLFTQSGGTVLSRAIKRWTWQFIWAGSIFRLAYRLALFWQVLGAVCRHQHRLHCHRGWNTSVHPSQLRRWQQGSLSYTIKLI